MNRNDLPLVPIFEHLTNKEVSDEVANLNEIGQSTSILVGAEVEGEIRPFLRIIVILGEKHGWGQPEIAPDEIVTIKCYIRANVAPDLDGLIKYFGEQNGSYQNSICG